MHRQRYDAAPKSVCHALYSRQSFVKQPYDESLRIQKSIYLGSGPTKGLRGLTAGLSVLQSRILSRMKAGSALGCSAGSSDAGAPTGCCALPVQMVNISLTRARAVGGCQTINPFAPHEQISVDPQPPQIFRDIVILQDCSICCSPALDKIGSAWLGAASEVAPEAALSAWKAEYTNFGRNADMAGECKFSSSHHADSESNIQARRGCGCQSSPAFAFSRAKRFSWRLALSASSLSCPPHLSSANLST